MLGVVAGYIVECDVEDVYSTEQLVRMKFWRAGTDGGAACCCCCGAKGVVRKHTWDLDPRKKGGASTARVGGSRFSLTNL